MCSEPTGLLEEPQWKWSWAAEYRWCRPDMYILDGRDICAADQDTWSHVLRKREKQGFVFVLLFWRPRWRNLLPLNQARQHDLLCAVNIRSCESSSDIFNSLWRDDAFYLSVTGWWVFTSEKTPSAYFRRASHCWCCPACGMHARAFGWCLCSIRGSQCALWHQPNGDLHVEDMTWCLAPWSLPVIVWFGVIANLIFLNYLRILISNCNSVNS